MSLEQLASGGFGEYFDPFTGKPLGSIRQSWTAAVALDWLADGLQENGEEDNTEARQGRGLRSAS
jgi:hypothetical protein